MKGFLRSKLTQTLAAFLMIAVAIVVPLSGIILHSHAALSSSQASWNIVPSPTPSGGGYLQSTSAVSSNDVWAVGTYLTWYTGTYTSMTMHWDGSNWTMVSSPNVANMQATSLNGVAAISSNDIWAVGASSDNTNGNQAVTMHYDGSSWSIVSSPNDGTGNNTLNAVAAVSTSDVWAVGQGPSGTLTAHYASLQSPSPTPSPSPSVSPTPPTPTSVPTSPPPVKKIIKIGGTSSQIFNQVLDALNKYVPRLQLACTLDLLGNEFKLIGLLQNGTTFAELDFKVILFKHDIDQQVVEGLIAAIQILPGEGCAEAIVNLVSAGGIDLLKQCLEDRGCLTAIENDPQLKKDLCYATISALASRHPLLFAVLVFEEQRICV